MNSRHIAPARPARRLLCLLVLALVLLLSFWTMGCAEIDEAEEPPGTTAPADTTTTAPDTTTTTAAPQTTTTVDQEPADDGDGGDTRSPAAAVAEALGPSVVNIQVANAQGQPMGIGSGVVFSNDGVIVTNNHVIVAGGTQPAAQVTVITVTGERLPATVLGRDPVSDLAVLQVENADLAAAEFLDDLSDLAVGDYAIAIGAPLGLEGTVTMGIISAVQREISIPGSPGATDFIQTDAAISPGNSGGALADQRGRVIGINTAGVAPQAGGQNIGFAIPSDLVIFVVEQILEQGEVRYSYLGVQSSPVTERLRQQLDLDDNRGVVIVTVEPGSPADQAGLQQGDVVVGIADREVASSADLFAALRETPPGEEVDIVVIRNGEEQTLPITLGERPTQ